MVVCCVAYGCNELFVKGGPVTFHSFPKNVHRRKLWEIQLKRKDFQATDSSKICSKHFEDECFETTKFGGTWLKPNAVPTKFDFPDYLNKEEFVKEPLEKRIGINEASVCPAHDYLTKEEFVKKPLEKRIGINEASVCPAHDSSPPQARPKRKFYLGDFDENDMSSPIKVRKLLSRAKFQVNKCKKKLRNLRMITYQLEQDVESLSEVINELEKRKF